MGCNCKGSKQQFQALIQQNTQQPAQPVQPTPPPITRAERMRLRGIRIAEREKRMAARNAAILAAQEAKKQNK